MRIVIAPNAFKGSLSALQAAEAIRDGVLAAAADADLVLVPIADGGDGRLMPWSRQPTVSVGRCGCAGRSWMLSTPTMA